MPRSTISDGDGSEADRGSVCSTIASTTSVTDKIQDLTQNFRDKFRRVHQEPPLYEGVEADDEEEEVIEISEEQLMQELDSMEPPLQVGFQPNDQLSCSCSLEAKMDATFYTSRPCRERASNHFLHGTVQVCSRLFRAPADAGSLKRLTTGHIDELRHKGYVSRNLSSCLSTLQKVSCNIHVHCHS